MSSVTNAARTRPRLTGFVTLLIALALQQLIASFWYGWQVRQRIAVTSFRFDWQFWFFWNDYWIFAKYLDWPRNTNPLAFEANLVGLAVVAVAAAGVYGMIKYRSTSTEARADE